MHACVEFGVFYLTVTPHNISEVHLSLSIEFYQSVENGLQNTSLQFIVHKYFF